MNLLILNEVSYFALIIILVQHNTTFEEFFCNCFITLCTLNVSCRRLGLGWFILLCVHTALPWNNVRHNSLNSCLTNKCVNEWTDDHLSMRCRCFIHPPCSEPRWFTELVCHNANAVTHLLDSSRFMGCMTSHKLWRQKPWLHYPCLEHYFDQNSTGNEWVTPRSFLFWISSSSLSNSSCSFSWGLLYRSEMSMQTLKLHMWRIQLPCYWQCPPQDHWPWLWRLQNTDTYFQAPLESQGKCWVFKALWKCKNGVHFNSNSLVLCWEWGHNGE